MITVLIPTIGRKETITRAIKSACLSNFNLVKEIIVLDNSQDKDFGNFIKKIIQEIDDKRISITTYETRQSMGNSWNIGLEQANCDWLIYLHDDDELILKNLSYQKIEAILAKNPETSFLCFDYISSSSKKKEIKRNQEVIRKDPFISIIRNCPKFASTIINKTYLKQINGWNDSYGYFLDLVGFIELHNKSSATFVSETIGVYYIHDNNLSSKSNRVKSYGDFIPKVLEKCFSILKNNDQRKFLIKNFLDYTYIENKNLLCRTIERISNYCLFTRSIHKIQKGS